MIQVNHKIGLYFLGEDKRKLEKLKKQIRWGKCHLEDFLDLMEIKKVGDLSEDKIMAYLRAHWTDVAVIFLDLILTSEDRQKFDGIKHWSARRLREGNMPKFESQRIVEFIRDFRVELDQQHAIVDFPRVLIVMPQDLPEGLETLGPRIKADWWATWGVDGLEFLDYESIRELLEELYNDWLERKIHELA
jgi:hypothetical protein